MPSVGTCQICQRKIKIRKKSQTLYKHGFGRGKGYSSSQGCEGSLRLPYELSNECCKEFLGEMLNLLELKMGRLQLLQQGAITELFSSRDGRNIHPGHPSWNRLFAAHIEFFELQIWHTRHEIQRMEYLIGEWKILYIEGLQKSLLGENYFRK